MKLRYLPGPQWVVSMCGAGVRRDSRGTGEDLISEDPAVGSPREVNLCSRQVVSTFWWWARVWWPQRYISLVQARLQGWEWTRWLSGEEIEIFFELVSFYLSHSLFPPLHTWQLQFVWLIVYKPRVPWHWPHVTQRDAGLVPGMDFSEKLVYLKLAEPWGHGRSLTGTAACGFLAITLWLEQRFSDADEALGFS